MNSWTMRVRHVAAAVALLAGLAACGGARSGAVASQATAVRVSYNTVAATDLPFLVAEDQGYFSGQGLAVTLVSMTPQVAITALSKGEIDFMNSPSNSIEGAVNGFPFKIVWDSWNGSAWNLVGKQEIGSVAELKGKLVATNNPGTAPYAFLREGLRRNGMTVADLRFVPTSGTSAVFASLTAGKVDAGVLSPPFEGRALAQGFRQILFLGDLLELPSNGLSTTTAYIGQHRPVVAAMLRAMLDAETWIKAHPEDTEALIAKRLNATPDVAQRTYQRMAPLLTSTGETSSLGIQQNLELLEEARGAKITAAPASFADFGPLHEVLAERR